jgi:hypothetical protein
MKEPVWKARCAKALASFAIAGILAAASAPARADDAASLLAKHKAYVGWSLGDGTYATLVTEWVKRGRDGKVLGRLTSRERGPIGRTDYKSERTGLEAHSGFTGSVLWQSGENGFATKLIGDAAKRFVAGSLVFDEGATLAGGTLEGRRSIDGKSYSVVRVKLDASLPVDLYIGDAGEYRRAVIDPGGAYETVYDILETSEPLPGKKIVSKISSGGVSDVLEKATPNVPLANADLLPPPATASWTFGSGNPVPIEVTGDRIYVNALVNGVRGHFILDSGAGGIVFNSEFGKRAHLETVTRADVVGVGGDLKSAIARAKTIAIGDNVLSNAIVESADLGLDSEGVDGLLGYDLLGAALVAVNLDESTIAFYDPAKVQPDFSAGVAVVVDLSGQVPVVPMKLNGLIDVRATLDSGNPLYVTFDRALVTDNHLRFMVDPQSLSSHQRMLGIGGFVDTECGRLDGLQFGPISYAQPPACMGYSIFGSGSSARDVLVGFDLIKHFNILFAYPASTLLLQPRKTEPK